MPGKNKDDTFYEDEYEAFLHDLVFDFSDKMGGPFDIGFDDFYYRVTDRNDCEFNLSRREYTANGNR